MNLYKEQILNAELPMQTESYTPISHGTFIHNIEAQLARTDFEIINESFIANAKATKVIGIYQLQSSNNNEIGPSIAFRNSYDKSMSAGIISGANVFVCTNGMFSGDVQILRKHTGTANIEMEQHIFNQINNLVPRFNQMKYYADELKNKTFFKEEIYKIIGDLFFRDNIIKSEQLNIFKKEYYHPTLNYGVERDNAWNIYNLFTYAIEKKAHPVNYLKQHEQVHDYFSLGNQATMIAVEPKENYFQPA